MKTYSNILPEKIVLHICSVKLTLGIDICSLCKTPTATIQEDANKQMKSRVDVNDAQALDCDTFNGDYGVPRDRNNVLTP